MPVPWPHVGCGGRGSRQEKGALCLGSGVALLCPQLCCPSFQASLQPIGTKAILKTSLGLGVSIDGFGVRRRREEANDRRLGCYRIGRGGVFGFDFSQAHRFFL